MAYVAFTEEQFNALDDFLTELAQGGQSTLVPKNITENGTYDPTDDDADGYSEVTVNVPIPVSTVEPLSVTENGTYNPPTGVDGYAPVTVNVSGGGDDYHPDAINDGNTYIYIEIPNEKLKTVPLTMRMANGSVKITWGDGSNPERIVSTQLTTVTHQYAATGRYVIKFESGGSGTRLVLGGGSYDTTVFGTGSTVSGTTYTSLLPYAIEIGTGTASTTISDYAFNQCINLRKVTLSSSVDTIGTNSFSSCTALDDIVLPSQMSSIGNYAFSSVTHLKSLVIPRGITTIDTPCMNMTNLRECTYMDNTKITGRILSNNFLLEKFVVPEAVDSIEAYGFTNPRSLKELHFQTATPPTAASNAFVNFPTDCIIYVPQGSLAAYTSASNYPDPSTYTYVEE